MKSCSKCRREKFCLDVDKWVYISAPFIQVFGKWICSDCLLKSGGGNREAILKARARLRKRIPPKTIEARGLFMRYERIGKIELIARWVREDLNRVYESYQVLKPLNLGDLFVLDIARKPKRGQMFWREIVYKKELEK